MRRALALAALLIGAAAAPAQAQMASAWRETDQAVPGRPPQLPVTYAKALELIRGKHYHAATRRLSSIIEIEPNRIEGWRLLGVAYAGQERWKDSLRAYGRALKLAPDDVLSHAGRGAALVALKDPAAGEEAAWLRARAAACAAACPEAGVLQELQARGPFAGALS
jgi:cytochrome c-type biogenesis protein CcmH/NrfG